MTASMPALSILDLAMVFPGERPRQAFARSVELAQHAERLGYLRVWYAEHHNMGSIASAAPAVLISHVGARTSSIRLGAGGVMLPNHSPLVIAEQFGTLAELYPDRIDLGVGRAPGTDQHTLRALRRSPQDADRFPQDVVELQEFLSEGPGHHGITATPGAGTNVPLYILGSSLFGAQLAASLGLPYAFASHFAPDHLDEAVAVYRQRFTPSPQLDKPYVIAAVNVVADDTAAGARDQHETTMRERIRRMVGTRGRVPLGDAELEFAARSLPGQQIRRMFSLCGVGAGPQVADYLREFAARTGADELMLSSFATGTGATLRSYGLIAKHLS